VVFGGNGVVNSGQVGLGYSLQALQRGNAWMVNLTRNPSIYLVLAGNLNVGIFVQQEVRFISYL
jgi:hypothetical protein